MSELGAWELERVGAAPMRVLAEILDDPNPIHLDGEAARRAGLGERPVNQGPANCAYVVNMLLEAFSGGELRRLDVRLLANVAAGDRVRAGGRIVTVEAGTGLTHCDVWLDVLGGERAVEGSAVLATRPGSAGPTREGER